MWFKKDKDSNGDSGDSSREQDAVADDGMSGVTGDESAVERVGETAGIGDTGDGVPDSGARVEDVEDGERVDRGESLVGPASVDEVPPAPREPEPTDRVGEEPIDAETGAYSDELGQALEDARGADEAADDGSPAGSYESRHAGGVDDSGVLADAPEDSSGGGSVLPRDGAVTDESAVEQTPEAAASGEGDALRDTDTTDSLEQDAGTDADREQREAQESRDDEADAVLEEAERREAEEAFAREHDPADHDLEAGEEFRQRGDWTADEHGGPQVQEPDGTVHDPGTDGADDAQAGSGSGASDSGGDGSSRGESGLEDVRDGGHGWGSAAPIEGGAQPLGHPVKAWHDTMTYVLPGEPGYDADPHEWFVDGETAERAGFRPAHGS